MKRTLLGPALAGLVVAAVGVGVHYAPGLLAPGLVAAGKPQATFYVSPTGTDTGSGTEQAPFQTLERARQAVAALTTTMTGDIEVVLRGGTYQLSEPLRLGAADSGANGHRVSYRAYPGERPVLSGGVPITGWTQDTTQLNRNRWKAPAPADLSTREFYVNGVRATRSRIVYGLNLTNQGAPSFPAAIQQTPTGYVTNNTAMRAWTNPDQIEFVWSGIGGNSSAAWPEPRCRIQGFAGTATSTTITMRQPCFSALQPAAKQSQTVQLPTYVENVLENTYAPGQFYLNEKTDTMYYVPRGGEDVTTATAIAPRLEQLVVLAGTPDAPVHDIDISGLTFAYTTWLQPNTNEGYPETQATIYTLGGNRFAPPGTVSVSAGRNIRVTGNVFTHTGAAGLEMGDGTQASEASGNVFTDISGNAIQLGGFVTKQLSPAEENRGLTITNNYINGAGAEYSGGAGIVAGFVADTVVAHNEVTNVSYSGISVGWGWSANTYIEGNRIEANNIHHVMTSSPRITDGGAIYTLGSSPTGDRTTITGNYIHDLPYVIADIYLDAGSNHRDVTDNVIADSQARTWFFAQTVTSAACCDNVFRNNYTTHTAYQTQTNAGANPVSGNQFGLTKWPAAAQRIINGAGLEAPYRKLTKTTTVI